MPIIIPAIKGIDINIILFPYTLHIASKFLSGYNMKSAEERKKYDENAMCKAYGKRMMFMSIPFIAGMIIDIWHIGIGCLIAWVIWFVMFILLLMDRHKREG